MASHLFGFQGGGSGGSGTPFEPAYGSFWDTNNQVASAIDTPTAMLFGTTDFTATSGTEIENNGSGDPTRVKVLNDGVYNFQFSAQFDRTSGGVIERVGIWIRVSETDVPESAGYISVQANNGFSVIAWNYILLLSAGQYIELMWSTTSTSIFLTSIPATASIPASPSIISTICKVN